MNGTKLSKLVKKTDVYVCLCPLLTLHEGDKSLFLYATPIRHTYWGYSIMCYDWGPLWLHMPKFCIGKGRQVINYNRIYRVLVRARARCHGHQNRQILKNRVDRVFYVSKVTKNYPVCFKLPRMALCVFTGHTYRPHLYQCHVLVLFPLRRLSLK